MTVPAALGGGKNLNVWLEQSLDAEMAKQKGSKYHLKCANKCLAIVSKSFVTSFFGHRAL